VVPFMGITTRARHTSKAHCAEVGELAALHHVADGDGEVLAAGPPHGAAQRTSSIRSSQGTGGGAHLDLAVDAVLAVLLLHLEADGAGWRSGLGLVGSGHWGLLVD
jgi:hypothetical protein